MDSLSTKQVTDLSTGCLTDQAYPISKMTQTQVRARVRAMIGESVRECANRGWFAKSANEKSECGAGRAEEVRRTAELREDLRWGLEMSFLGWTAGEIKILVKTF